MARLNNKFYVMAYYFQFHVNPFTDSDLLTTMIYSKSSFDIKLKNQIKKFKNPDHKSVREQEKSG